MTKREVINIKDEILRKDDLYMRATIMTLLTEFIEKHPLVVECGGEYIMQDDEAQVDALQLVCDIFDNM